MADSNTELSVWSRFIKRAFDISLSLIALLFLWWLILVVAIAASLSTGQSGFFTQTRIGRYGKPFKVIKIRTMKSVKGVSTTVTTSNDARITAVGKFFRKTKIDELPQLFNVLIGKMSFVGPRPDVPGFADKLDGEDKIILTIRPGITGPATLAFRDEEGLLEKESDPEKYNRDVIFPKKILLNKKYIQDYSFWGDIGYIFKTVFR